MANYRRTVTADRHELIVVFLGLVHKVVYEYEEDKYCEGGELAMTEVVRDNHEYYDDYKDIFDALEEADPAEVQLLIEKLENIEEEIEKSLEI